MPLTAEAQAVVDGFGQKPGVTADQLTNLKATLEASPALTQEVNDAVAQGHLQSIVPLNNPNAGGEYDPTSHEMRLPLSMLATPAGGTFDTGEPTFVLGHELQHGFNAAAAAQARTDFTQQLGVIAQSPAHDHDYTAPIGTLIAANRRDEAGAEISGWNAMVSAAQKDAADHAKPAPRLAEVYARNPGRMKDVIDVDRSQFPPTYAMKPNLTANADPTLTATADNLEGMGKNYFDHAGGLGHNGNSGYGDYYGAYAVGVAVNYERTYNPTQPGHAAPHTMSVNLTQLNLDPGIMAQNGIDLGANTQAMPYSNTGTQPPTPAHFDHTIDTHVYTPLAPSAMGKDVESIDNVSHPGNALFRQALSQVHQLDASHGRVPDERSENLSACSALAAHTQGMTSIDHIRLSEDASKVFLVQGDLSSPDRQITHVNTEEAVQTSVAQSSVAWQQQAQQRAAEPMAAAVQQQSPSSLNAPVMG